MLIYPLLKSVRQRIKAGEFDYITFNSRFLREFCGISYQDLYALEKQGLIDPLRRVNGKIELTPIELQKLLALFETFLLSESRYKGRI